jgi:hypothetical protein
MTATVQVGTILMENRRLIAEALELHGVPYPAKWGTLTALDGSAINREITAAGWNFFFMAAEVKVMFFGGLGARRIEKAVQRMLAKVKPLNFNCLEGTGIVAKRFLGVPYSVASAHSRHVQQSCYLEGAEKRQKSQHDGLAG